ncbi:uncharacterized protein NEMAJ01_2199 [Nematocida major]|uniref:uncharacterized protein n=1 Tax=Nematocida major TaxID=1912982 RepID=UPI0020086C60|nr:uncharacterized protein NEMAJ01_2199 [Nematocida major]KAH9387303.1 hypothetical protein NEMAJ01_2199 [Nematocida major]
MLQCNVCRLAAREVDGGFVCANGHIMKKVEEVEDITGRKGPSGLVTKKKRRYRLRDDISTLTPRDLCALLGLRYLAGLLAEFSIPKLAFHRYKEMYYSFTHGVSSASERNLAMQYKEIADVFTFLVKRDLEEKGGNLFTVYDFLRKFDGKDCMFSHFLMHRMRLRKAYMINIPLSNHPHKITTQSIVNLLQKTFPNRPEYFSSVFGVFNDAALQKMCTLLGVTKTKSVTEGFLRFKEALVQIRFCETSKNLIFSESLLGAYLYLYFAEGCIICSVGGHLVILEKSTVFRKERTTRQDFFCRESNIANLKQMNLQVTAAQDTDGWSAPVLDPAEFPAPEFEESAESSCTDWISAKVMKNIAVAAGGSADSIEHVVRSVLAVYRNVISKISPAL